MVDRLAAVGETGEALHQGEQLFGSQVVNTSLPSIQTWRTEGSSRRRPTATRSARMPAAMSPPESSRAARAGETVTSAIASAHEHAPLAASA